MPKISISQPPSIPERESAICQRFREARQALGVQQKDFARLISIPVDTLRTYEYARVALRFGPAWRLAVNFKVSLRWLVTGEGHYQDYFELSSDVARFVPCGLQISSVYDSLINRLEPSVFVRARPSGAIEEALFPLGVNSHRKKNAIRDAQLIPFIVTIRLLPDDLVDDFVRAVDEAVAQFYKKHAASLAEYKMPRKEDNYIRSLAQCAGTVAKCLGLNVNEVIESNRAFPVSLVDPETKPYEPSREELEQGMGKHFGADPLNRAEQSYMSNAGDGLTYAETLTYKSGPYENNNPAQQKTITQRIKAAREKAGLSQAEASTKWGFRLQTIQQWEQGRRDPRGAYRKRLETVLDEIERK